VSHIRKAYNTKAHDTKGPIDLYKANNELLFVFSKLLLTVNLTSDHDLNLPSKDTNNLLINTV